MKKFVQKINSLIFVQNIVVKNIILSKILTRPKCSEICWVSTSTRPPMTLDLYQIFLRNYIVIRKVLRRDGVFRLLICLPNLHCSVSLLSWPSSTIWKPYVHTKRMQMLSNSLYNQKWKVHVRLNMGNCLTRDKFAKHGVEREVALTYTYQ
jgi:hypothetical protein